MGLKGPHIFGEKKQETKKPIRERPGRGTLNTCAKSQGLTQKRRGHLDFSAVKCKNHGSASQLLSFSLHSILSVKFDLILVLRSQFFDFLRETLYKHALEHLEAAGPEKKWVLYFSSYNCSKCLPGIYY